MDKTFELYWLKDFGRMSAQALEYALRLRDIETTPSEALSVKRSKLRSFSTGYRNKGTADLYLDYAEAITGGRGEILRLKQGNFQTPSCRIGCDADPVDAATDDDQIIMFAHVHLLSFL